MIYFDNGATTYPKPRSVLNAVNEAVSQYSFNSGRGGYKESLKAAEKIFSVREKIVDMFSTTPDNIIFTCNCTYALNMAIKGSVKKGDHIIISSLEHNSVSRVVQKLQDDGIAEYDTAAFSYDDDETVNNFEKLIKSNTSLIICMHSSNVFGVVFPIERLGKLAKKHSIRFIVDGAQGAGSADINMKRDNIDILCCPGHKSLMGIMGSGFMALSDGVQLDTIIEGGTGSGSMSLRQPDFTPDRFEAGTLNNPGIISIGAGIDFINQTGMKKIYNHELAITQCLYEKLGENNRVILYTPYPAFNRSMPILAFNVENVPSEKTASYLAKHGISCRAGYHCSPLAHKHFGTIDTGAVRLSIGYFNTQSDCAKVIKVINNY